MNTPNFVCGSLNHSVQHPSGWDVDKLVGKSNQTSIGGVALQDISYVKHQYTLDWDMLSYEDFVKLNAIYEEHLLNANSVYFTYEKYGASNVECIMDMSSRNFVAGSGTTGYYSKVSIVLTEVNKYAGS